MCVILSFLLNLTSLINFKNIYSFVWLFRENDFKLTNEIKNVVWRQKFSKIMFKYNKIMGLKNNELCGGIHF